jgi:hypothetical protein
VKEADDVHRWADWIYRHDPPRCLYGFGESYGAAIVLQSLAVEPRYCAVVAESPFSTAREMSYERISGPLHLQPWFGRTLGRPIIASAVLYARLRYSVDLLQPSPLDAVVRSRVPVLLIHGENDHNISPRHSIILAGAARDHIALWLVPNAFHTGAWAAAHQEFEDRVLAWFVGHSEDRRSVSARFRESPSSRAIAVIEGTPISFFLKFRIPGVLSWGEESLSPAKSSGDANLESISIPHPGKKRRGFGISEKS